jgi:hypothetical protein
MAELVFDVLPDCSTPWRALLMAVASWFWKLAVVDVVLEEAPLAWLALPAKADGLLD